MSHAAESRRAPTKLSAVLRSQAPTKLSAITEIDIARERLGITGQALSHAAGFSLKYMQRARGRDVKPEHISRLRAALRQLSSANPAKAASIDDTLVVATYNSFLVHLASALGHDVVAIRAQLQREGQCTADKAWRAASHVRQAAIYLTNTALGVPQFRLARALDLTAAAVCLAIRAVEDRRDDPGFDAILNTTEQLVTGRE